MASLRLIAFVGLVAAIVLSASGTAPSGTSAVLVALVPVDEFPSSRARRLEAWLEGQLPVSVVVTKRVRLPDSLVDPKRKQLVAERALDAFVFKTRHLGTVIGITSRDMYPLETGWNFAFAFRQSPGRIGLISSGHMDPVALGGIRADALFERRLRKYVLRYALLLGFQRKLVGNPRSVLTDSVTSVDDLDRMEATATPRPRDPARQRWVIAANRACSDAAREIGRIATQPTAGPDAVVARIRRVADAQAGFVRRFEQLPAVTSDRPRIREVATLLGARIAFERASADRLERGYSESRLREIARTDARYGPTVRSLFVELGLETCAA